MYTQGPPLVRIRVHGYRSKHWHSEGHPIETHPNANTK